MTPNFERTWLRARKVLQSLRNPRFRRALVKRRVLPAIEHDGFDVERYASIIDVGANRGQFALWALERSAADVVSIEPLPAARETLVTVTSPYGLRVTVHPVAVGSASGTARMHITEGDDNSSVLKPTSMQLDFAPESRVVDTLEVAMRTLDEVLPYAHLREPILLKVDVQGLERDVLAGGVNVLRLTSTVLVELSFIDLYSGGTKPHEVINFLSEQGFHLVAIRSPLMCDRAVVQCDAVFERDPRASEVPKV